MSDIAIRVEHLSKRYRIGQYFGSGAQYKTLRESLTNAVSAPLRRLRDSRRRSSASCLLSANSGLRSPVPGQPSTDGFIWALRDVSFEVKRGEVLGIIGRNGAGKSTLLKILTGITEPTEGRVELNGRVNSLLEVGTGFHPELTGRENVRLGGAILGMTRKEIDRKFDEIVDFSGVETYIDTPVKRYSSGMHVRLGFAVAAHLEPEILLVDEVLAVGDYDFQQKCLGKMDEVSQEGRTVLIVSHNMASILNLCQNAILLNSGKVVAFGNALDTVQQYLAGMRSSTGEIVWSNLKTAPGDDTLKLHSVRVLSADNELISEVDIRDDILIEFRYWNLREGAKIWTGVHVFNQMGIHVLGTANAPSESLRPDRWWNQPHPVGLFKSICRIPGNLLNAGTYGITAVVGINALQVIIRVDDVVTFRVFDSISVIQKAGKPHGGVVRPRLDWRTKHIGNGPKEIEHAS